MKVFDYLHEAEEVWNGACLSEFSSRTRSNGRTVAVGAQQEGGVFRIAIDRDIGSSKAASDQVTAPSSCVGSYAYWDLERLRKRELLNGQTGELSRVSLVYVGENPMPRTGRVARQYSLTAEEARIDLWYDAEGQWLALATAMDGRLLAYVNETVL